jgi:hypothetical protein
MIYEIDYYRALVEKVEPSAVEEYLKSHGWEQIECRREDVKRFQEIHGIHEVCITFYRENIEYSKFMCDTVETIAAVSNKSIEHVVFSLLEFDTEGENTANINDDEYGAVESTLESTDNPDSVEIVLNGAVITVRVQKERFLS